MIFPFRCQFAPNSFRMSTLNNRTILKQCLKFAPPRWLGTFRLISLLIYLSGIVLYWCRFFFPRWISWHSIIFYPMITVILIIMYTWEWSRSRLIVDKDRSDKLTCSNCLTLNTSNCLFFTYLIIIYCLVYFTTLYYRFRYL